MKKHISAAPSQHLELRVHALAQLFNSLDPTPFLNKDLDREAEAFIENWAMLHSHKSRLHITVHLATIPEEAEPGTIVAAAIHNYFDYKAHRVRGELRLLLRQGRASLVIGLVFVTLCLLAADAVGQPGSGTAGTIARESLTIVGWVAMWRPLQILLYDWWPLVRRIRIYKALKASQVRVVYQA